MFCGKISNYRLLGVLHSKDCASHLLSGRSFFNRRVSLLWLGVSSAREDNKLGLISLQSLDISTKRLSRLVGSASINRNANSACLLCTNTSFLKVVTNVLPLESNLWGN